LICHIEEAAVMRLIKLNRPAGDNLGDSITESCSAFHLRPPFHATGNGNGRYVGAAEVEDDGEPFDEKMARLTALLREQTEKAKKLDQIIWANLEDIGYGL